MSIEHESFEEQVARLDRERVEHIRLNVRLMKGAKRAVQMRDKNRNTHYVVVSKDPVKPCWRASWFDEYGAWSHAHFPSMIHAVLSLCGHWLPKISPPYGHSGQWIVEKIK